MKVVIATDSFKGTLSAQEACNIIANTIVKHLPEVQIVKKPMADGGEGTAKAMIDACNGKWISKKVMGPLPNKKVTAGFAWFNETNAALVEMASASGITLLKPSELNPLKTTTYGTGQLIRAAAEQSAKKIYLAVGGSATIDVGVGAAIALGWKFLDRNGNEIGLGGEEIENIHRIMPPASKYDLQIEVLCDVTNPLVGPKGAARVYGPQKGAIPEMVERLDTAHKHLAKIVKKQFGIDIARMSGGGAAGGLAAGAVAFMNASISSGIDTIIEITGLNDALEDADWVITGEGKFDHQSLQGKVVSGIIDAAKCTNTKAVVIAGDVQMNCRNLKKYGIIDAIACRKEDMPIEYAMKNCKKLLADAAVVFIEKYLKQKSKK